MINIIKKIKIFDSIVEENKELKQKLDKTKEQLAKLQISEKKTLYKTGDAVYSIYCNRVYGTLCRWHITDDKKLKITDIKYKYGEFYYTLENGSDYLEERLFFNRDDAIRRCAYLTNNHLLS